MSFNCSSRCQEQSFATLQIYVLYRESKQHLITTNKTSSFNFQNDTHFFSTFKFLFYSPCRNIRKKHAWLGETSKVVVPVQAISLISQKCILQIEALELRCKTARAGFPEWYFSENGILRALKILREAMSRQLDCACGQNVLVFKLHYIICMCAVSFSVIVIGENEETVYV